MTIPTLNSRIDNFKAINDRYGYKVGAEVLIRVAEILQKEILSRINLS